MLDNLTGYLLINKPKDISSFDCIRYLKKIIKQKVKIGHTGTLDNFATGLLIICISRQATRLISSLMNLNKSYIFKAKLDELTDTFDCTGKIIQTKESSNIKTENILTAIKELGSSYMQVPPIYSALKYGGQPLYRLARENKLEQDKLEEIIKQKSRKVNIDNIELINFESPFFTIDTTVSKGTYIRSLANDIAQKLNSCATTYELERTSIGPFNIKSSIKLTDLKSIQDIQEALIPIEKVMNLLSQPS